MNRASGTGARRRQIGTTDPLRKAGWQIRQSVADAVRQAVETGAAESQNALVERALLRELAEIRRQRVYAAYAEAAADPAFVADMLSTTTAFDVATRDALGRSGRSGS